MKDNLAIDIEYKQKTNLNALSREEKNKLAQLTYENENYFHTHYKTDEHIIKIDEYANNFRNHIQRILTEKKILKEQVALEALHNHISDELKAYDFAHGVNQVSTYFYETDNAFNEDYLQFIRHIRQHHVNEPFYFQSTPTIRIHCPNAINGDLYPRYHTDICYGHPPEEVNIWIPLTQKMEGHGFSLIKVEESYQLLNQFNFNYDEFIKDATYDRSFSDKCKTLSHPASVEFGEALLFDPRCIHSGEPLQAHTRISIDMRVIPVSHFNKMNIQHQGSGRLKILFEPGECYHKNNSDEI